MIIFQDFHGTAVIRDDAPFSTHAMTECCCLWSVEPSDGEVIHQLQCCAAWSSVLSADVHAAVI